MRANAIFSTLRWSAALIVVAALAWPVAVLVQQRPTGLQYPGAVAGQQPGHSEAAFTQPSVPSGVDYVVPTEAEIKQALDRIRTRFERSTPYRIVDVGTGKPITDLTKPVKTAGIDGGEFNDWTYPMGVVLAAMFHVTDVTGDARYQQYAVKNFDFIFDHLDYFKAQAKEFGPQARGYRRLIDMKELDDCGAIGAALVKAYTRKRDERYRQGIAMADEHIGHRQMRMPDGPLARPRPQKVSLWVDDFYMSIPFLAQMGKLTGERRYFDDAAKQVIQASARLFDPVTGLYDHSWFENATYDPKFFWGRGAGWALMAEAELLSVLPEDHPDRAKVLAIFQRAVQGVTAVQSRNGLWHQLLDKNDSYLETSASAMFTFAIARGVNRGWLAPVYAPVAQAGWQAIARRIRDDGAIEGICVGTTAAYDAVYYYNRPTDVDALQGYGPVLMAGAELIVMLRSFDIDKTLNTFHYRVRTPAPGTGKTTAAALDAGKPARAGSHATTMTGSQAAPATAGAMLTVRNPIDLSRSSETIVLSAQDLQRLLAVDDVRRVHVRDEASSRDLLVQAIDLDDDGKFEQLIFQADLAPRQTKTFALTVGDRQVPRREDFKAHGRFVRERRDDFAWENDRIAHRMYGAALETWAQEPLTSSAVDVWTKRVRRFVIDDWYLVDDYHADNGDGGDFYSAGKTRGCGGNGLWSAGKLFPSANFRDSKLIANGPIRVMFDLVYQKWDAAGAKVSEVKRVTLDAGQNLDRFESHYTFDGQPPRELTHAIGIKTNAASASVTSRESGVLRTWEPLKGEGNLGCGVVVDPAALVDFTEGDGNYLAIARAPSTGPAVYYAGFGWDRSGDFSGVADWDRYLTEFSARLRAPVEIALAKR